jgi:hypothetical protein
MSSFSTDVIGESGYCNVDVAAWLSVVDATQNGPAFVGRSVCLTKRHPSRKALILSMDFDGRVYLGTICGVTGLSHAFQPTKPTGLEADSLCTRIFKIRVLVAPPLSNPAQLDGAIFAEICLGLREPFGRITEFPSTSYF